MPIILVVLLANVIRAGGQTNYCQLCTDHVACNTTTKFYPDCNNAAIITLKKCWILRKHNQWRDQVAGGKVQNLKPACRMAYMEWDEELAKLAEHDVVHCKVNRDKCVKSLRFPRVVQNLGLNQYDENVPNKKKLIQNIITNWYKEKNYVQQSDSDLNISNVSEKIIQFTTMMGDRTTHVGCAASTFQDGAKQVLLLICNYGSSNRIGGPVYEACNKPGEKCEYHSTQYQNVCGRSGKLFKRLSRKQQPIRLRFINGGSFYPGFNPGYNQSFYQGFNPGFNPSFNPAFNPAFYTASYPNFNQGFNPGFNPNLNPGFNPVYNYWNYAPQPAASHNGPNTSYNNNDQNKNNNSGNSKNSNNRNTDNSSKGDRILNLNNSTIG